jgi:hypothetical protein
MDSDTCVGFKRRIMEIGDTQEALLPPLSPLPPTPQSCRIPLEDKEEQDVSENTNNNNNNLSSFLSDSKKSKCSEIIINEENQELGFASGADRTLQVLESSISGCGGFVKKVEAFGEEEPKNENGEVGFVSDGEAKQGILVSGTADNEEKVFAKSETELESQSFLEVKKKKLLKDLEDKIHAEKVTDFEGSLKIEVIDETALIEVNDQCAERKGNKNGNQEVDGKKARRLRRKAKKVSEMMNGRLFEMKGRLMNVVVNGENENACRKSGDGTKKVYSRKEMEALRFANIEEQRKNWKEIYEGLGAAVAREYEDLASSKHQKQIRVNFDPRQHFGKKELAPAILSKYCYFFHFLCCYLWNFSLNGANMMNELVDVDLCFN